MSAKWKPKPIRVRLDELLTLTREAGVAGITTQDAAKASGMKYGKVYALFAELAGQGLVHERTRDGKRAWTPGVPDGCEMAEAFEEAVFHAERKQSEWYHARRERLGLPSKRPT